MTPLPTDILAIATLIREQLDPKVRLLSVRGDGVDLYPDRWEAYCEDAQ